MGNVKHENEISYLYTGQKLTVWKQPSVVYANLSIAVG